ncbi:MAG: hypothetical protein KC431_21815, partial [Myxococcales bacterium]|nr:hypothetical protein [Myxococcales bacterium]
MERPNELRARHLLIAALALTSGCQTIDYCSQYACDGTDDVVASEDGSDSSGSTSTTDTGCVEGELDCACGPNGECVGSLVCVDGICALGPDDTGTTGSCTAEGCDCVPGP